MQGGIATFITGLESIPFVKHLSERFNLEPTALLKRGGVIALVICGVAATVLFLKPASGSTDTLEVEESPALLQQSSTEFNTAPIETPAAAQSVQNEEELVVYVSGAVGTPGVYTLKSKQRVADAVDAAGGLLPDAAQAVVNFALPLEDGMQIHIPALNEVTSDAPGEGLISTPVTEAGESHSQNVDTAQALININTADAAALQTLEGVGPATAQKIIDYRSHYGSFKTKEDLMNVSGIGEKKYAALEARITV